MSAMRVLIVEDEVIIAADIQETLERIGYTVVGAVTNGLDAVRVADAERPDLVLMDIRIKGPMDGIETAHEIRKRTRAPVVYLTAYSDEETLRRAKATEPFGYLLKPFEEADLRVAVDVAIYKHRMEARLREHEALLATILDSVTEGVVSTNLLGEIAFLNPRAQELLGYTEREAVGRHLSEVCPVVSNGEDVIAESLRHVIDGGSVCRFAKSALLIGRVDRRTPVVGTIAPLRDGDGMVRGAVLVLQDASAALRVDLLEREVRDLRRDLIDRAKDLI